MANNPLYPGYSPRKKDEEPINPLYPGYYTGGAMSKIPQSDKYLQPLEYNFDVVSDQIDELGDGVLKLPLAGPRWLRDRIVDDWKGQLKVSVSPDVNIDVTELDDYATDDLAGATTSLSLNPKDWGIGHEKGWEQTRKQLNKTLTSWLQETTGINANNILESDFSDIENRTNERLWLRALGYAEDSSSFSERVGGRAVADRTTALFSDSQNTPYLDRYGDPLLDKHGRKLSPLDLRHVVVRNATTGDITLQEDDTYKSTALAAADFERGRDDRSSRDTLHTKFVTDALKKMNKEIQASYTNNPAVQARGGAVEFFDTRVKTLETIGEIQKAMGDASKYLEKNIIKQGRWKDGATKSTEKSSILDKAEGDLRKGLIALENSETRARALSANGIPQKEIDSFLKETQKFKGRVRELEGVVGKAKTSTTNAGLRETIKSLRGSTPDKNFTSRSTFQDGLGGNLRRSLEKSALSKKDYEIGSVIYSDEVQLRAKKVSPLLYRMRQDRIRFATKEVLDAYDKGGFAQILENHLWKEIKNRLPASLERASSGSIVGEALKRTNYFGLKVDDAGTPPEKWFFDHPRKEARFERKYGNRVSVSLDKELRGSIGGKSNKIKVSGSDVANISDEKLKHIARLNAKRATVAATGGKALPQLKPASLEIIGDKNIKHFKLDKNKDDQILFAKLLNNDRSQGTLDELSAKMFNKNFSSLTNEQREEMEKFFTKMGYANNWVEQKSGGKIMALGMQKGALNINETSLKDFMDKVKEIDPSKVKEDWLRAGTLYISGGKHLDAFKNSRIDSFLKKSSLTSAQKETMLEEMLSNPRGKTWKETIILELFGKKKKRLNATELAELDNISKQLSEFSDYMKSMRNIFGDVVDDPGFIYQMFLQVRSQGITGFNSVNVDEKNKSLLLIRGIFNKNESMNKGYKLTEKRYMGRLERINNRLQSIQRRWNNTLLARGIKLIKNWQEILSEKIVALLSKLLAKLLGITAAATGILALLGGVLQGIAEKVIQKGITYVTSFIKAVFKFDFRDINKMLEEDFTKLIQALLVVFAFLGIIVAPIFMLFAVIASAINPVDNTRLNNDGYGIGAGTGEPNGSMYGCDGCAVAGQGSCKGPWGGVRSFDKGEGGFYYSQQDPQWKDHPMEGGSTIGAVGCTTTCVAMVYNYFGYPDLTPQQVADEADGVDDRYLGSDYMSNFGVKVDGNMVIPETFGNRGMSRNELKRWFELHPKSLVILKVWTNPDSEDTGTQHFVIISGFNGSDYTMYDPDRGPDLCLDAEYGDLSIGPAKGYYLPDESWAGCSPFGNINPDALCAEKPQPPTPSVAASAALDIVCELEKGFGGLFNRPGPNMPDIGNSKRLWNEAVFQEHNPCDRECWLHLSNNHPYDLYWCTWLIKNSYGQAYSGVGGLSLGADAMCKGSHGLLTEISNDINQLTSGDVACFYARDDKNNPIPGRYGHVGVLWGVTEDFAVILESNGGGTINTYTVDIGSGAVDTNFVSHFMRK